MSAVTEPSFFELASKDFKENFWNRLSYVIMTLSIVWASNGGQMASFWVRLTFLGPIFVFLAWKTLKAENKMALLERNPSSLMMGLSAGVLLSLALILFCYFTRDNATLEWARLKTGIPFYIYFALIILPANDVIFRGVLTPLWGFWSTCFLDAANWTFSTQNFALFWVIFISAATLAFLTKKFGFMSALVARITFTILFWTYLSYQFTA
jgi:hypothetical protein